MIFFGKPLFSVVVVSKLEDQFGVSNGPAGVVAALEISPPIGSGRLKSALSFPATLSSPIYLHIQQAIRRKNMILKGILGTLLQCCLTGYIAIAQNCAIHQM
jgi:hypothetical protein